MRALDIMSRPVRTIRADDPLELAAALLSGHNITAAPVLDPAGELVGIISEGDLLRVRASHGSQALVGDVMNRKVIALPCDAPLSTVAQAMLENNIHSVPIVDDGGALEGILCRHDLLRAYVRTDDLIQVEVQQRLDQYAAGDRIWTATVKDGVVDVGGPYDDEVERNVVGVLAHTVAGVTRVRQHG